MTATLRTFIAIALSQDIQNLIEQLQQDLKKINLDVSWVKSQNAHITLKFLGNTLPEQLPSIQSAIKETFQGCQPFSLTTTGLGAFPDSRRARVIWLGVELSDIGFADRIQKLEEKLQRLKFKQEDRAFSAHITLGRVRSGKNLRQLPEAMASLKPASLSQTVDGLVLFQSTLTPQGSIYQPLARIKFTSL